MLASHHCDQTRTISYLVGKGFHTMRLTSPGIAAALCLVVATVLVYPAVSTVAAKSGDSTAGHGTGQPAKASRCPHSNKPSGTVTFSDWQFPDTLNRYQSTRLVTREVLNALFDSLFQYDNHARLIPQMATSVPTINNGGIRDGGKTIVVQLKPGLRWSNGAEITSRDIWFGWKVGMDKASGPDCLGGCDAIKRIDTPSRYTAVLRLSHVDSAAVPAAMPDLWPHIWPGAWNNSPHGAALKLGQDPSFNFESSHFPTDGAYQVAKFVANNHILLRPMKYYSDMVCGGYVNNLIFAPYPSKTDLIVAASARKTDITTDYNLGDLAELNKHKNVYRVQVQTSFSLEHLELNLDPTYRGKANPLANSQVRLALALALDKYTLIRNTLNVNTRAAARLAAWSPFVSAPDLKQPLVSSNPSGQWDPIAGKFVTPGSSIALRDARTLLGRTKFKGGFALDLYTTTGNVGRQAQMAVIATSWAKLAVKVKPNYVPAGQLLGGWNLGGIAAHGNFQVAMFAYLGAADPDQYKYNLLSRYCDRKARVHSTLNGNYSCIRDPGIDRSFTAAASTFAITARSRDYAAVAGTVNRQAYWIPLYFRPNISTADGRVANVSNNPTPLGPTWNIYAWRTKHT